MSGSRSSTRELVYCHECADEFYKQGDSITCPRCRSEFTEIIGNDFDPRAETAVPFSGQTPFDDANDPDEMDIDEFRRVPGSTWRDHRDQRQGQPMQGHVFPQNDPYNQPIFQDFQTMVENMTGQRRDTPRHFPQGPPGPWGFPHQPHPGMDSRQGRATSETRQPNTRSFTRTYGSNGGGGIQISFTSSTNSGGGWQTNTRQGDFNNFNDAFSQLFGSMGAPPGPHGGQGQRGPGGQMPTPLAAIFGNLFGGGPPGQLGDAVFSNEQFDRVMSQLMEQQQSGSAPGPATEAAINQLPKKKVSEDMLDETTKQAECSICMDNVTVGEEVLELPCSHWFHDDCVRAWLTEHDTCPICRTGIMPKEGSRNTARAPTEVPLNNEDPIELLRRESGTRDHPFVVPESPAADRRRPNPRRHSSDQPSSSSRSYGGDGSGGGGGITGRMRSFFGGGGSSNNQNDPGKNNSGR